MNKIVINSDKAKNLFAIDKYVYKILLLNNKTDTYIKDNTNLYKKINLEAKKIVCDNIE